MIRMNRSDPPHWKDALKWWTKLPKTSDRQKENLMYKVSDLDGAKAEVLRGRYS